MEFMIVQLCKKCIDDVVNTGDIEFTKPVVINEVTIKDCDNLDVNGYNTRVAPRGTVTL